MARVEPRPALEGDEAMYARVVTAHAVPDKLTEGIHLWRDSVMPAAREQKGFKSGRLLVNRQTGKIISVGLWETEADLQASGEGSAYLQAQLAKFASLFTAPPMVENYEVGPKCESPLHEQQTTGPRVISSLPRSPGPPGRGRA